MKIAVFGAGAIGGYLAVKLHQAGAEVSIVARGPHLAAMREHGLTLKSGGLTTTVRLPCTDKAEEAKITLGNWAGRAGTRAAATFSSSGRGPPARRSRRCSRGAATKRSRTKSGGSFPRASSAP